MAPVPQLRGGRILYSTRGPTALPATTHAEPLELVTLVCTPCEVRWRGRPSEPCWSCGAHGLRPAGTTLVRD